MYRKLNLIFKSIQSVAIPVRTNNFPCIKSKINSPLFPNQILVNFCSSSSTNTVTYAKIKKVSIKPDKNNFIIDVRNPEELKETGVIPGSINIPLDEVEMSLKSLSNDMFKNKYGVQKPDKTSLIIFSCKSGKRSANAQLIAEKLGYKNIKNYIGGWLDWENNAKKE